jgi:hypothetical protein
VAILRTTKPSYNQGCRYPLAVPASITPDIAWPMKGESMGEHRSKVWAVVVGAACVVGLLGALGVVAGCAEDEPPATSTSAAASAEDPTELAEVFADLARESGLMPVYGLTDLPSGVTIAAQWWPVVELAAPSEYKGPAVRNPRVSGEGEFDPEIQLVFSKGNGWMVIVENFRGDLGDVEGEKVGTVAGNTATLYEVNGGILVQWSDGGRWYGVFGRGVSEDDVVDMALAMRLIDAKNVQ